MHPRNEFSSTGTKLDTCYRYGHECGFGCDATSVVTKALVTGGREATLWGVVLQNSGFVAPLARRDSLLKETIFWRVVLQNSCFVAPLARRDSLLKETIFWRVVLQNSCFVTPIFFQTRL